jgi:hypothetical protein
MKKSRKKLDGTELLDIETILQSNLKPVSARPEFIEGLQKGLLDHTFSPDDFLEIDVKEAALFAFFGFAGLVFVFSMWIRLVLVIISTIGVIQSRKKKSPS